LRTVRTTSSGCSSPYSHPREEPVGSPAAPASRTSCVPRPPEPPHRPRRELQLTAAAVEVALPLQLPLDPAQRLHVVDRLPAERPLHQLGVDVVQRGARVVLVEHRVELFQVGDLLQRAGRVAEPERAVAVHPLPTTPAQVRPGRPQPLLQPLQLAGQPGVAHRTGHQVGQLLPLLVGQAVQQPLLGRRPAGQRVDQLGQVGRVLREELPVLGHEPVELLLGVLTAGVGLEHVVQRGDHLPDPGHVLGAGAAQRVPHPAELAVQHLPPQQVLDLLVRLPGLVRAPLVVRQLADGAGRVVRQRVQLRFREPGRVVRVGEQLPPLGRQRPVQQPAHLLQRAVQPPAPARLPGLAAHLAAQLVQPAQPARVASALLEQPAQRLPGRRPGQHVVADLVQRPAHVERWLQRVGPAVPGAVPVAGSGHGQPP
jgi:hypothetical protein